MRHLSLCTVALLALACSGGVAAQDATQSERARCTDPGFDAAIPDITLQRVGRGFEDPIFVTGDRRGGLLVVEQSGTVRRLNAEQGTPGGVFLDIRDRVVAGGERGLLGLALHPRFLRDGRLYVNYTTQRGDGLTTRVSEFAMTAGGTANLDSERVLLAFSQPYGNHNGGMILFGPDGDLYIATGDGGSGNDPQNNGQRLDTLLGKILRIQVNGGSPDDPYRIPADNPFVDRAQARPEIYAYGLRNPWRFSIDWVTGRMYAGDVGQNAREEIDVIREGGNYGWRIMEGTICTPGIEADCDRSGLEPPILDYGHTQGYSVTGGYVYRGASMPALCGVYVYGDFGSGRLWGLRYDGERITRQRLLDDTDLRISSFGEDDAGELYVVDYQGRIYRIAPAGQSSGS